MRVAENIRRIRTEAGLTQKELAKVLKVRAAYIRRIESPSFTKHSLVFLRKLSHVLHCNIRLTITPVDVPKE